MSKHAKKGKPERPRAKSAGQRYIRDVAVHQQRERRQGFMNNKSWDKPWPDPQHTPWKQWSNDEKAAYAKEWDLTIEEADALMTATDDD